MQLLPHEIELIRKLITEKSERLIVQDKKCFAKTGLDISNWRAFTIGNRRFLTVSNPVFHAIVNEVLPEATRRYPEKFGTGKPKDVTDALFLIEPWGKQENFMKFLGAEQFCWVVEVQDGILNERILRIDLFRKVSEKPNDDGTFEFTGGIFHALKHYSHLTEQGSIPLSTHKAKLDIHPRHIIHELTRAFFIEPGEIKDDGKRISYTVLMHLNAEYHLKVIFYFEPNTEVFFVTTAYKKKKRKPDKSIDQSFP
jgi:hypothetical protein